MILTNNKAAGPMHFRVKSTGEEFTFHVLEDRQCRVGIEASDDIVILRDRVYQDQNRGNK